MKRETRLAIYYALQQEGADRIQLNPDSDLKKDLQMTNLSLTKAGLRLQTNFNDKVPIDVFTNASTIEAVGRLVEQY